MTYTLLGAQGKIRRHSDGHVFLEDERDPDYPEYLAWLQAGGTPEIDTTPVDPVPASVTAPQARVALLRAGLLPTVEAMVAQLGANSELAIFWEYSVTYGRQHPVLLQMAGALGLTSEQVDDLFRTAAAITS